MGCCESNAHCEDHCHHEVECLTAGVLTDGIVDPHSYEEEPGGKPVDNEGRNLPEAFIEFSCMFSVDIVQREEPSEEGNSKNICEHVGWFVGISEDDPSPEVHETGYVVQHCIFLNEADRLLILFAVN